MDSSFQNINQSPSCLCLVAPSTKINNQSLYENFRTLLERISDIYNHSVQNFSHWLYRQGKPLAIPSFIAAAFLGEPVTSFRSGINAHFYRWQPELEKKGIYDANNPLSLEQLKNDLERDKPHQNPVLLLHGSISQPSVFYGWAGELEQAVKDKKIGPLITLQLPTDLEKRMDLLYKTIDVVHEIFQTGTGCKGVKVDIIGHSLGGFAGHLAQIKQEHIQIKDENGVMRRWHSINPLDRNEKVGKVVSVAAPTWLCCKGQKDETTKNLQTEDIYPLKILTEKNILTAFTPEQLLIIQNNHPDLLDIVATQDAITPTVSPLPENQVVYAKHMHGGILQCREVCKIAIDFLKV